ncbi:MAG TPA: J domain-containing protein [Chitinivibrionales bacterium]
MNYKDYYAVLGVSKEATSDEIRRAYRKLAMKYHPDKTKGDKAASAKFTDINEANQVLSDPEKRRKYDQFGADWKHYEEAGAQPGGFDWKKYAAPGSGRKQGMDADEFESMFAQGEDVDLFELLFGGRGARRRGGRSAAFKGEDLSAETTISLDEAYNGSTRLIQLDGQKIKVTIPRGIAEEQVLRLPGKGMVGIQGGPSGDLYLTVKVGEHAEFHRKGNDLHRKLPVELYTAVLGGKALVKTPKGAVKVDILAETQNNKELRLRGLGMPVFGKKNDYGDMFVTIDIQVPDHLTPGEIDLFRKLAALRK